MSAGSCWDWIDDGRARTFRSPRRLRSGRSFRSPFHRARPPRTTPAGLRHRGQHRAHAAPPARSVSGPVHGQARGIRDHCVLLRLLHLDVSVPQVRDPGAAFGKGGRGRRGGQSGHALQRLLPIRVRGGYRLFEVEEADPRRHLGEWPIVVRLRPAHLRDRARQGQQGHRKGVRVFLPYGCQDPRTRHQQAHEAIGAEQADRRVRDRDLRQPRPLCAGRPEREEPQQGRQGCRDADRREPVYQPHDNQRPESQSGGHQGRRPGAVHQEQAGEGGGAGDGRAVLRPQEATRQRARRTSGTTGTRRVCPSVGPGNLE